MDSFEFNKIVMAVLGTVFVVFSLSLISDSIYHVEEPEVAGYAIEVAEGGEETQAAEADTGPAYEPIVPMLASADVAAGEAVFRKCGSCHNIEKGGANKVGPNLYGVVGAPIASHEGFGYSSALASYGEGKTWTYEELNGFLWNPKKYVSGTAMGFAGLSKAEERANLIAWMNQQSDNPEPLPGS